jgi:signal transduction histidine kinase/CheY-like chemotaxis protein
MKSKPIYTSTPRWVLLVLAYLFVNMVAAALILRPLSQRTTPTSIAEYRLYVAYVDLYDAAVVRADDLRWSVPEFRLKFDLFLTAFEEAEKSELLRLKLADARPVIDPLRSLPDVAPSVVSLATMLENFKLLRSPILEAWSKGDDIQRAYTDNVRQQGARLAVAFLLVFFILSTALFFALYLHVKRRNADVETSTRCNALRTDLVEARADAARAMEAKNVFLAMVSHELRTPLQTLVSSIDLLSNPEANQARILPRLKRSALALDVQLNDLLALAKAESIGIEAMPFAISALIARACSPHIVNARHKGLVFRFDAPVNSWFVSGHAARLSQIVDNLVANAVRYTAAGEVFVSVTLDSPGASFFKLRVEDTGYGIEPQDIESIYKPFTRFHTQYDAPKHEEVRRRGGVGLTIVKSLVDGMGGAIDVESIVGEGTVFTVTVPMRALFHGVVHPRADCRVLVVDDQADILIGISDLLVTERVEVNLAVDGYSAVESWRMLHPSIMLIDLDLPDFDGREIVRRIRRYCDADTQLMRPVFVAMSAAADLQTAAGDLFDGFLRKPVTGAELSRLISFLVFDAAPRQSTRSG